MKRPLTDFETVRAQELLVQRATEGLADDDLDELDELGGTDTRGFDVAAAAIDLATLPREPLPAALAADVFAAALAAVGARAAPAVSTAPAVPAVAALLPEPERAIAKAAPRPTPIRRPRAMMFAGWMTAAAAAAVATGLWVTRDDRAPAPAASPVAARSELLATVDDTITATWDASALGGDVVWSPRRQHGFLRLRGLPANKPAETRYQLWIFDGARDERFPVDGGLFDAAPGAETIVAITPRIPITRATQFVITAEVPTGVVVSDRQRVIASARIP